MPPAQNEPDPPATDRSWPARAALVDLVSIGVVIASLAYIETARRLGFQAPVPFLILYGSVAVAASFAGLRAGLAGALLASAFVVYSALQQFGPASLTGGVVQVISGISIAFVIAVLLGRRHDRLLRLTAELEQSRAALARARDELAGKVELRTDQLSDATTQLSDIRSQLDNTLLYSPAGVFVVGRNNRIESANPAALKQFGIESLPDDWRSVEVFMQNVRFFAQDGQRYEFGEGPLTDALKSGIVSDDLNFRIVRPDGADGWFRGSFAPIRSLSGEITGATVILLDVTDKMRARLSLEQLAQSILRAQEDDRSRIAYELHDEIGQDLAAIKMNLHAAVQRGIYEAPVKDCIFRLNKLIDAVRNMSLELRPAMLDDLGLVAAVRWYLTRQQQRSGLGITFDLNASVPNLPADIATACFRVVQEAVTNAIQHSRAQTLKVRLYNNDEGICLEVSDDGCGFDYAAAKSRQSYESGFGLIAMRERVSLSGGSFEVESGSASGTTVVACFRTG